MPQDYFGERIAETYDAKWPELFDPILMVDGQAEIRSTPHRYVWPSELDLMAQIAGMALRERWAGWNREPYTSDSRSHVSVGQKSWVPAPQSSWSDGTQSWNGTHHAGLRYSAGASSEL